MKPIRNREIKLFFGYLIDSDSLKDVLFNDIKFVRIRPFYPSQNGVTLLLLVV